MLFRNYNDFEIVNLVKQGNEQAFHFMVEKYRYLIAKNIGKFNLGYQFDDMFQEALMILHKSALAFDESFNKTFMRFFEMNLVNRFISLKSRSNRYGEFLSEKMPILYQDSLMESPGYYISEKEIREALDRLSEFEKKVFQAKVIENRSIRETAEFLNISEKKIYNAMDRIKNKLKLHLL